MPRSDMWSISGKDQGIHYPPPSLCVQIGEHQGTPYEQPDLHGDTMFEFWTCCDDSTLLGEIFDCDTCLEPGTCPPGEPMPPGWVEDTNGHHCPRCQPHERRNAA